MELKAIARSLRISGITCLVALGLAASQHHGVVKFGTVPVPGATVTATKGDTKLVAITDDVGFYSFAELADGVWKIQIDMPREYLVPVSNPSELVLVNWRDQWVYMFAVDLRERGEPLDDGQPPAPSSAAASG